MKAGQFYGAALITVLSIACTPPSPSISYVMIVDNEAKLNEVADHMRNNKLDSLSKATVKDKQVKETMKLMKVTKVERSSIDLLIPDFKSREDTVYRFVRTGRKRGYRYKEEVLLDRSSDKDVYKKEKDLKAARYNKVRNNLYYKMEHRELIEFPGM